MSREESHWGHSEKAAIYKSGSETSPETEFSSSWSWTSSLQNREKINFCCLSHLVCGSLLWQTEKTNIGSNPKSDSCLICLIVHNWVLGIQGCSFHLNYFKECEVLYLDLKKKTQLFICLAASGLSCGKRDLCCVAWGLSLQPQGCPVACRTLTPQPGMEPVSPALQGRFLTTGPPRKSYQILTLSSLYTYCSQVSGDNFFTKP